MTETDDLGIIIRQSGQAYIRTNDVPHITVHHKKQISAVRGTNLRHKTQLSLHNVLYWPISCLTGLSAFVLVKPSVYSCRDSIQKPSAALAPTNMINYSYEGPAVPVPRTLNKDERFQTLLVGQVGMTLQLFFLSSTLSKSLNLSLSSGLTAFLHAYFYFNNLRLKSYCKLWCMGKDPTCVCETPNLFIDRTWLSRPKFLYAHFPEDTQISPSIIRQSPAKFLPVSCLLS